MPKVHLYIRDQFTTTAAGAAQVSAAVEQLQKAVEGEGGSLRASVTIEEDEVPPEAPEIPPLARRGRGGEERGDEGRG